MGLTSWLLRTAALDPRPLVVSVPFATSTRVRAEAQLARRGWRVAYAPAHAGMLVVCGTPGRELSQAVRRTWAQLTSPRVLVELPPDADAAHVAHALDDGAGRLADVRGQMRDAQEKPEADDHDHAPQAGMDRGGQGHEAAAGHAHGHHMGVPGGLAMADRGDDRDGLKLDQLHVPLGPILNDWPCGLVVETVLQGDVVQQAEITTVSGLPDGPPRPYWDEPWLEAARGRPVTRGEAERRRAAAHLDSLGRLLDVAGWSPQATHARRLRDRTLAGEPEFALRRPFDRFARRVRGSRTLRWMLRDVPCGGGDVWGRASDWLARTENALVSLDDGEFLDNDEGPRGALSARPVARKLAELPGLLAGAELATARLIVAGIDPDVEQVLHG
ncbi:hypothetical protein [Nonomuraea rubra]|uniref:Uncharacterized protein n=1 Tax=Nonomuraea rubra TaxID=46180 RepID=A0A7X0U3K2_9ACTN|nr:hypothetical protein [Nonomuraea rubra]MBB6553589.1 hypothetical protein [Nonomuraea rubra]